MLQISKLPYRNITNGLHVSLYLSTYNILSFNDLTFKNRGLKSDCQFYMVNHYN